MSDPKYRDGWPKNTINPLAPDPNTPNLLTPHSLTPLSGPASAPNTIVPPPQPAPTAPAGEVTVRAIRTPAPAPTPAVQVRPVWRSEARPVSLEDLQRGAAPAGAAAPPAPVQAPATPPLTIESVPIPVVPLANRPAPPMVTPSPAPFDPEEAASERPAPGTPSRSGWLNHALNDWLREEPAPRTPTPRPEAEAAPRTPPGTLPHFFHAPEPVRPPAPAPSAPAPAPRPEPASTPAQPVPVQSEPAQPTPVQVAPAPLPGQPLTLQEALASDLLPDLPVDLLERLWEQAAEEAAQAEAAHAQAEAQAQAQAAQTQVPQPPAAPEPLLPPRQPSAAGLPVTPAAPVPAAPVPELPTFRGGPQPVATLEPMFPGAAPFLARFLPRSAPQQMGLNARFCDLHAFLKYLHDLGWYGYLHVGMGDLSAYALVYEGRVVAAAAVNASGEQALGELLSLYEQGATMSTYPLPASYAQVLSGVGTRAWKFDLSPDFTGVYADPEGALFYVRGEVVAVMIATLPYEGAFPASPRPQTLILPRSFAGWAHLPYVATLRGRDANNPITSVYHDFRAQYGEEGAQFIRALAAGQTPAEYAARTDAPLHELEALLLEFTQGGYLKEQ